MNLVDDTSTASIDPNHGIDTSNSLIYRIGKVTDCDQLVTLINNAYRGELSYQGWTNEDALVPVPRTNENALSNMINSDKYIFLVFFGAIDQILKGCIHLLHQQETKTAQLGMFAVRPHLQGRGYGKFILSIAENYAIRNWNVECIELESIVQRPELTAYYTRRGYVDTGQRKPFRIQQTTVKYPMRDDLEICLMRKYVKKDEQKIN